MPTGRVKWFDVDKGFGFVVAEDGSQAFLHSSVLPDGAEVTKGTRLDYDVVDSRRGAQVLKARLLSAPAKVAKVRRRPPEDMAVMVEDVIKVLDDLNNGLQHGRYPDPTHGNKVASLLRAIADDLES
ncbi:cold shock domain-containing protein [Brevibacterium sp. ZH18]|uniref:cold-shock protein n=1 Tax=Brevibacterium sp. ZH18 TaxID=2927784 RepID=UPI001F605DD2|nr:cold shock domain-containing protein [Brevibacterium sp. ZH18]MCI4012510.1 cold shock domain-containing protein [Brevibacterium sp. ZH18]